MHNDILKAIDNNKLTVLVMLDLSAAFDTVDYIKHFSNLKRKI